MKNLRYLFIIAGFIYSCSKGNDYCETPRKMNGFDSVFYFTDGSKRVEVKLDYEQTFEDDQKSVLFSFSTPTPFINPKGDGRLEDVTSNLIYQYQLKDTANAPDSILISAYAFNDCGESETVTTWLRF